MYKFSAKFYPDQLVIVDGMPGKIISVTISNGHDRYSIRMYDGSIIHNITQDRIFSDA